MLKNEILVALQKFLEEHSVEQVYELQECKYINIDHDLSMDDLEGFLEENKSPSFAMNLFSFIDSSGRSDVEIYKKAGIDRKLFSKIRSNPSYKISKKTAIALALALELNKNEAEKLLYSAGFSLSKSNTFDLVILFCIENEIYNLDDVNYALHQLGLNTISKYE
ncbi:hypothetical protein CIB95_07910 [Lottiidibacillus patelloidae]|uniref:Appr-1-p processing protein n=1 Tax=Lottiidibacillus patelloidae TaxID=2670334 RepID=A0A263BVM4_9BACI|nr:hypothetical protein [Lottiidibacillus patelloidae]OZM57377.1 hypothetical protein CIB95_07910 [Lottiidibacillus patelloidae]